MKKNNLFLLFLALAFTGCNGATPSDSSVESSDVSSASSVVDSTSVVMDEIYHSTGWDRNLLKVISCVTGEEWAESVPEAIAEEYEYCYTIDETSGLDLVIIDCYGIEERTVEDNYEKALEHASFNFSYDYPYGYKEVSDTQDLVVQYELISKKNRACFELLVYMTEFRVKEWPESTILLYMGETFPSVGARSYEIILDYTIDYKVRLDIYAYHADLTDVSEYTKILQDAGFAIEASTAIGFYEAVSPKGNLHVQYSLFEDTLSIYVYNDYPYAIIYSTLGFELPRLEEDGVTFDYGYVEVAEDNYVLTLYYDNSSENALATYGDGLSAIGFEQIGEEETNASENGFVITTREYIYLQGTENEHYIVLLYEKTSKSLAVAIYY